MAWVNTYDFPGAALFRDLDDEDEEKFRQYARENDPPELDNWTIYHPVCREEWLKRGITPNFLGCGI